jgi:hypothetical protein
MAAAAWILGLAVWAVYEAFALFAGRRTLSMQIWMAVKRWPFLGWIIGLVVGGLLVHFGWIPAGCDPTKGF